MRAGWARLVFVKQDGVRGAYVRNALALSADEDGVCGAIEVKCHTLRTPQFGGTSQGGAGLKKALMFAAALVLAACGGGDPREAYVGTYTGTLVADFTVDGQPQNQTLSNAINVKADKSDPNLIDLGGSCDMSATLDGANFTVAGLPKTCPPNTSGDCTSTLTVTSGSGSFSGDHISLSFNGNVNLDCGTSGTSSGTFTETFSGSRS